MTSEEILKALYEETMVGNAPKVLELTNQGIADGMTPDSILFEALIPSLEEVGARFERGDFFVPEMLIAGRAMAGALNVLRPLLADTGAETMTGGRVFRVRDYVGKETFMCTYGDGLADVNISDLLKFHKSHGKLATVTAVRPVSRFGVLEMDESGAVQSFQEKPQSDGWINAGYFVFEPKVFDYLGPNSILEREPMANLAKDGQLVAYKHDGFFQPMDTYREMSMLNEMWDANNAPWKVWK